MTDRGTASLPREITRREAIRFLGAGAAVVAISGRIDAAIVSPSSRSPSQGRAIVRTILEDVAPDRLSGTTLIHEHLSIGPLAPAKTVFEDDVALMADEVKACAQDGVSCIVDAGTDGLGRKIEALRTIASRSGMLIVACGGLHRKSDYPPAALTRTADQIANDLVEQAKRERWGGIGEMGTGAAVPMDPVERKGMEAAAQAHLRTGLPIISHTSGGCARCALDQVDLFEKAGVDLQHVVIGHLNDIHDVHATAPIAIGKRGAYLGFDHSGRPDDPRADEHVRTIRAVLDAGLEDRICLSSDFGVNDEKSLRKNGGPGIDRILTTIVPRLRQAGVSQATLNKILVENPRRVLTFVPKGA
jgi:phosphotriesterase-related protein